MPWPAVVAAGIAATSALQQQVSNQRAASSATKQGRSFALHQGNIDWARQQEWRSKDYQERVKDAKAAGLHPLFALGAGSSNFSPTSETPQTGSYAGRGIANAGQAIASGITAYGRQKAAAKLQALNERLLEQQIEANDIDLMSKASVNMRLQQELLQQPTHAQAFSQAALDASDLKARNYDLAQQLKVTTPYGQEVTGAYGGKYAVPGGVTPQGVLEELIGEAADVHGIGIAARMILSDNMIQTRVRRIKNQAAAARRQIKRGKRSRYLRGRRVR